MKNKIELKKAFIVSIVFITSFLILFAMLYQIQYQIYTRHFNEKLNVIIVKLQEKYPNLTSNDIMNILNSTEEAEIDLLRQYGIDLKQDAILLKNDNAYQKFLLANLILLGGFGISLLVEFGLYNHKKNKKLVEITNYIEQINYGNYSLDIDDNTEDELSILKNEIYKTTIMLKEVAENARNQEISLKNSLEDISHQLKTPLTSIMIMLDNMIDHPEMDKEIREEFIKDCKKEITNIHFLVQALLKLSKFDANTIQYHNQTVLIKNLIDEAVNKVSILCDLKNVNIQVQGDEKGTIYCDNKWQVEAITNLLKNAIEYSESEGKIEVSYGQNKLYTQIEVKDYGKGIESDDLPHIFERFYKGTNSSKDSVGIGLALAKKIIEKNNGSVFVESELGKGTTFIIRYFQEWNIVKNNEI
ncbi:MAG: HAMP domain-containing histidine kinase [Clostridia bacterium]|nr:HAMP domain-containing histidine kinase [Clostridia bacterium]